MLFRCSRGRQYAEKTAKLKVDVAKVMDCSYAILSYFDYPVADILGKGKKKHNKWQVTTQDKLIFNLSGYHSD